MSESQAFIPVLILGIVVCLTAAGMIFGSYWLGPRGRRFPDKNTPYECGNRPMSPARVRFSVRFYLVAVMFILFDIEVVFLYPWAVRFRELGLFGLLEMFVFLLILFVGWIYVVKKGVLEWAK